ITLTKAYELGKCQDRQAGDMSGCLASYEGRGLWVPPGMTAQEIMIGAAALERFGVEHYEARSMVREVLSAIRDIPCGSPQSSCCVPKVSRSVRSIRLTNTHRSAGRHHA